MDSVLQYQFNDLDQLRQLIKTNGWESRMSQLKPGDLGLEVALRAKAQLTAVRMYSSASTAREMQCPSSGRTFGLLIPEESGNRWCHRAFDEAALLMMPRSDFVATSAGGVLGYQFAFSEEVLSETLVQLERPDNLSSDAVLLNIDKERAQKLASTLNATWSNEPDDTAPLDVTEILAIFLEYFTDRPHSRRVRSCQRRQAFNRAREYMHENLAEAITMSDICRSVDASRRSITQAFDEAMGCSPISYLKVLRLNKVHSQLATESDLNTLIVDVANAAGFWHMGQFAKDYRSLFGELPSDTLARSPVSL